MPTGQIECYVYIKDKFHAKANITQDRLDVVRSQALAGSSNLTRPGPTQSLELNVKLESCTQVAQLQHWYDSHWQEAEDVTADILKVVERHTQVFTPFDVYSRSLQAFVSRGEQTGAAWATTSSDMFQRLDKCQQEAYQALIGFTERHRGTRCYATVSALVRRS